MTESLKQLVVSVTKECENKRVSELVRMANSAKKTPRGNVIICYTANKIKEAWSRDPETVEFARERQKVFDVMSTDLIMRGALACIHSTRTNVCTNCRAYDLELIKRNKLSELICLQECRLHHEVDLDKEMAEGECKKKE